MNIRQPSRPVMITALTAVWALVGFGALISTLLEFLTPNALLAWGRVGAGLVGGIAALLLAFNMSRLRAWVWAPAVVYHGGIAVGLWAWLFTAWPYTTWVSVLPARFTSNTWTYFIALGLFLLGCLMALMGYGVYSARPAFFTGAAPRIATCPTCGITLEGATCPYCDRVTGREYYLEPLLKIRGKSAPRILLAFGEGHWKITIGRNSQLAHTGDAWINEDIAGERVAEYRTISRENHATLELNPANGNLSLASHTDQPVRVNERDVTTSAPVAVGDIIQLGDARFVLGAVENQPVIARLENYQDGSYYVLRFHTGNLMVHVGRGPIRPDGVTVNTIELPGEWRDVSRAHATFSYDPYEQTLYVINDSDQENALRVNSEAWMLPGDNHPLPWDGETRIDMGQHPFVFVPQLYEPVQ